MKQTAIEWLYDQIENHGKCIYEVIEQDKNKKCYHPLTERKHTSDIHFECTICGYNNY